MQDCQQCEAQEGSGMSNRKTLDETIDDLHKTCECDACERYRKSFASRAGYWAARIEQSLKARIAWRNKQEAS